MIQQVSDQAVSPDLSRVLIESVGYAGEQLSALMERDISLRGTHVERVRLERLPSLLDGEERTVTAIYLAFNGDIGGHVLLALAPEMAGQLVGTLLMCEAPEDIEPGSLEASALGEVGNVTAASFLNAIANTCELTVLPSPPVVVQDMIGALLDSIIIEMSMESMYALCLHTVFEVEGDILHGDLVLLPTAASCDSLEERLLACKH